ncbi:integrase, catalytic region, zinc finger, CCHC-type containing protein [Tanacetum coccineum]
MLSKHVISKFSTLLISLSITNSIQSFIHSTITYILGFVVPVFSPGDDPIACLNQAMAFLTVVANPRNQATIQDDRVTVQQVQGRQGQNYSSTTYKGNATSSRENTISGQARVVKCYNCQGEGHVARKCTQPK